MYILIIFFNYIIYIIHKDTNECNTKYHFKCMIILIKNLYYLLENPLCTFLLIINIIDNFNIRKFKYLIKKYDKTLKFYSKISIIYV